MANEVKISIATPEVAEVEVKEELTGFDSVPEEKEIIKEEVKMEINVPKNTVTTGGALEDVLHHPNLIDANFIIPKKTLEDYVSKQLKIKNEVVYYPGDLRSFRSSFIHPLVNTAGIETGSTLTQGEAQKLEKIFYPGVNIPGNKNPINGVIRIKIAKSDLYTRREDRNLLEYSTLDDPEVLYQNPAMQKFTLPKMRKILVEEVDKGMIYHFIPVLLAALSYLGVDAEKAINEYYISCGEVNDTVIIHIRKDMKSNIL